MTRLLSIILVVLVVDIVGGLFIGMKVVIPMLYPTEEVAAEREEAADESREETEAPGMIYALDPININPHNSAGDILSVEIVIEADDQEVVDELGVRNYEIRDRLSAYLAFKTANELNDQENWEQYKQDMMDLVNESLSNGEIAAVYIPSKIIQFQ